MKNSYATGSRSQSLAAWTKKEQMTTDVDSGGQYRYQIKAGIPLHTASTTLGQVLGKEQMTRLQQSWNSQMHENISVLTKKKKNRSINEKFEKLEMKQQGPQTIGLLYP